MPHLITASDERIELEPRRTYVVGRGKECEVRLHDAACSRKHAQFVVGEAGGAIFLEDLDSRNGTFLNGNLVAGRKKLADGDEVRVGASIFRVHLRDGDSAEPRLIDEAQTMGFESLLLGDSASEEVVRSVKEKAPWSADFVGQLSLFGIVEVLQMLMQTHRSATLNVALPDAEAAVELRQGEVVSAACGKLRGFPALVELGRRRAGIFWLVETTASIDRNVHEPTPRLLMELCRAVDESGPPKAEAHSRGSTDTNT
ncbi:MAG: FHA domain-containing protein [Planctomycetota bacterium]